MNIQELKKIYEKELIQEISLDANGVGSTKAGAIAEDFDSIRDFLNADKNRLKKVNKSLMKSR